MPVREMLDIWPLLPIAVRDHGHEKLGGGVDGIIVMALEHTGERICEISLWPIPSSRLAEVLLPALERPFPAVSELRLRPREDDDDETAPVVVPASIMGGRGSRHHVYDPGGLFKFAGSR
jgi:hypothetical protein